MRLQVELQGCFIQILPDTAPCRDAATTLRALEMALQGGLPEKGRKLANTAKHLVTYRTSTKQLLHALKNCIAVLVPHFDFSKTVPEVQLEPKKGRHRYELTDEEKLILGLDVTRTRHFLFDARDGSTKLDCQPAMSSSPLHLVFAVDEGTEGFLAWQWLCSQGSLCVLFPDTFHKLHRKQAMAIAGMEESAHLVKRLTKMFRSGRAPWKTSKFRQQRLESRTRLITELEGSHNSVVLQCVLGGLARDNDVDVSEMSCQKALQMLKRHSGVPSPHYTTTFFLLKLLCRTTALGAERVQGRALVCVVRPCCGHRQCS